MVNRWERELARLELEGERAVLEEMRRHYEAALSRVNEKIEALAERDDLPGIRQRRFQEELAEQIGGALDDLRGGAHATLEEYLVQSYEQGFAGALYSLQKQGVPLVFPIDQRAAARAASMTAGDVKLSKRVYADVGKLQGQVIAEITRGFADAESATRIAGRISAETDIEAGIKRNVALRASQAFRRSMTIARTEKGRVRSQAGLEAMRKAKGAGADVVKQWDSTLDGRTRPDHVAADGQIRELEEPFSVGGCRGLAPHLMGRPEQDVNCRCTVLQRARRAFEIEDAYTKWDGVSQCYADLSDSKSYAEFMRRYTTVVASAASLAAAGGAAGAPGRTLCEDGLHGLSAEEVLSEAESLDKRSNSAWSEYKKDKRRASYESTYNAFLDALSGNGFLSAQHGVKLEGKEIQLGAWLSAKGHDVRYLYASSERGDHTPDMLLDGEPWEMKRVVSGNVRKLKERIDEAARQSDSIIADLSVSELDPGLVEGAVLEMLEDRRIRRIMVVRDGRATLYEK